MEGLECLGAEVQKDERTAGEKTLSVLQKAGPALFSAVTDELKPKEGPVSIPKYKTEEKSWFTRPVLGPLPGAAVLVVGGGVLAGLGYALKRIFAK